MVKYIANSLDSTSFKYNRKYSMFQGYNIFTKYVMTYSSRLNDSCLLSHRFPENSHDKNALPERKQKCNRDETSNYTQNFFST